MIFCLHFEYLFFRACSKSGWRSKLLYATIQPLGRQIVGPDWVPACAGTTGDFVDCRSARKALGHRHAFAVRGNDGS